MLQKIYYLRAPLTLMIHLGVGGIKHFHSRAVVGYLKNILWASSLCTHHSIFEKSCLFNFLREFQATLEFRPIRDTDGVEDHQITVCVRKRPLNKKELARKEVDVITVPSKDRIIVHEPKTKVIFLKIMFLN